MITIRKSTERGRTKNSWLQSRHSFSFGDYYDPEHQNFGVLQVINEDKVSANRGFDTHKHKDMEIISYVLSGELAHKDSLGNGSSILAGDVQIMSAGTGIAHSEFNPKDDAVHFLQIWITPERTGLEPAYQQRNFTSQRRADGLTLIASPEGKGNSLFINQNTNIYILDLEANSPFEYEIKEERKIWLQILRGSVNMDDHIMQAGDGAGITQEKKIKLTCMDKAEILLFDLG